MIDVVAAVIRDNTGKILIAQRNLKKSQGGLWEFPGGKIEPNETKEEAIIREIKEEMDIDIKVEKNIDERVFNYPDKSINLIALECKKTNGDIKLIEHENVKWVDKFDLKAYEFAPADEFIINAILNKQ